MTRADFLSAILAAPGDDVLRLAFADWLEEQGEEWTPATLRESGRWIIESPYNRLLHWHPAGTSAMSGYDRRVCVGLVEPSIPVTRCECGCLSFIGRDVWRCGLCDYVLQNPESATALRVREKEKSLVP